MSTDVGRLPSPCYLMEESRLEENLELIDLVQRQTGCVILLALKGFAMWSAFPLVRRYLAGCAASSYHEARLARDRFGGHVHLYAPAYKEADFAEALALADRISFNSLGQWRRFGPAALAAGRSCGLRVNPGIDEVATPLYNPCGPESRLGIPPGELVDGVPSGIEGLHVHALCESDAVSTERLIAAVEGRFGPLLPQVKWLNLGGGHLMTRRGYDVERLVRVLGDFRARHPHIELVLEPGSAIAWDAGVLVSQVLDVIDRGGLRIAMLDASATAHMPDVLEMPYRPNVRGAHEPGVKAHTYRLGGPTCLAGDVIGDYSFEAPLSVGDPVIFEDMLHYTMVKTTLFNGVQHPAIAIRHTDGAVAIVRRFGYQDYENRLS